MRTFDSLSEREILALAISLEEEDERIYADFAEGLRQSFPASAAIFDGMRDEESGHRRRLIELFREKFGDHIPLLRRNDVRGFVHRKPVWLITRMVPDRFKPKWPVRPGGARVGRPAIFDTQRPLFFMRLWTSTTFA